MKVTSGDVQLYLFSAGAEGTGGVGVSRHDVGESRVLEERDGSGTARDPRRLRRQARRNAQRDGDLLQPQGLLPPRTLQNLDVPSLYGRILFARRSGHVAVLWNSVGQVALRGKVFANII